MKIAEGLQLAKVGFGLSLDEAQQRQVRSLHAVKTTEIDAGATSFEKSRNFEQKHRFSMNCAFEVHERSSILVRILAYFTWHRRSAPVPSEIC